MTDSFCS